jgi:TFIIF-interacting CTD phosphatase-like protein
MLTELKKNDFELILFSSNNANCLEQVAATLQKDEPLFDFLINKDHLHFDRELDLHILDLNILLGPAGQGQTTRDLKDIIVVSNTCCRHLIHYLNGVPVKEYNGNKRDLSLYALTKYLKSLRDVKDVRQKIIEDFGI